MTAPGTEVFVNGVRIDDPDIVDLEGGFVWAWRPGRTGIFRLSGVVEVRSVRSTPAAAPAPPPSPGSTA